MLSKIALTISAMEVFLVKPKIAPRTFGFQCGAPKPVRAGTEIIFSSIFALEYNL